MDNTKVLTEVDLSENPILTVLGGAVGDTVTVTKAEGAGADQKTDEGQA